MALSNLPIFPQKIQAWAAQILNATGTGVVTVLTAGSNGSIVESLNVSNTDVANFVYVYLNDGTTNHLLSVVPIAATAGANAGGSGTPSLDILRSGLIPGLPVDANGNYVIYVPSGWKLNVGANLTVGSGKTWDFVAMGADY